MLWFQYPYQNSCWNSLVTNITVCVCIIQPLRWDQHTTLMKKVGQEWVGYHDSRLLKEWKLDLLSCVLTWTSAVCKMCKRPSPDVAPQYWTFPSQNCLSFHHKLPSLWYSVIPAKKKMLKCQYVPFLQSPGSPVLFTTAQGRVEGDWGPWPPCCGFAVLLLLFSSLREITKEQKRSHLVVTTFKNSLHILWNTNQLQ